MNSTSRSNTNSGGVAVLGAQTPEHQQVQRGAGSRLLRVPQGHSLVILAPAGSVTPTHSPRAIRATYAELLAALQRLRARVYCKERYLSSDGLTADGRHVSALDEKSWHLLLLDCRDEVAGCMRYTIYPCSQPFETLAFADSAMAHDPLWSARLRASIESVRQRASEQRIMFAQAGAWALAPEARHGSNALLLVQATFALAQLLGNCLAICTANCLSGSNAILSRLGAWPLADAGREFPIFWEPAYFATVRLLQFDSRMPAPAYTQMLQMLKHYLAESGWITPQAVALEQCA